MKNRILSIFLLLAMVLILMPSFSVTVHATDSYSYIAGNFTIASETKLTEDDYSYSNHILAIKSSTSMTISGRTATDSIVTESNATITLADGTKNTLISGKYR